MLKRLLWLALLLLAIAGCSAYHKELDSNPAFSSHRFSYYDVEVAWRSAAHENTFLVTGTVSNLRSYYLRDFEITARLVDQQGNIYGRQTYADFPTYISPGRTEPFKMAFHTPSGTKIKQIHFSYYYWLTEAAPQFRGNEDVPTFGSFTAQP